MSAKQNGGGGGLSRGGALNIRWSSWFKPPKDQVTKIRLIPGDFECLDGERHDFYQYVEIYCAASSRSYVSSAEFVMNDKGMLDKVGGEDLGWDVFQQEVEAGVEREHRSVSIRAMNAFTLLHLVNYHLVPVTDEEGNVKTYTKGKKAGQVIMERMLCTGKGCDHCKNKLDMVFGKKLHWSVGQGHLEQIGGFAKTISANCSICFGDKNLPEDGEGSMVDGEPPVCSHCGESAPIDIFDCNISVKREGTGTKSTVQMARWRPAEIPAELQELAKPWNFKEVFAPDPLEVQAKLLRLKNAPPQSRAAHARDYE